jgi:REP element-mobilizing transposase RayT
MKASSRRARKRHVQQELFRRGGKRKRAGRKPKGARAGSPHRKRPKIRPNQALHVVMRVVSAVGNMRRRSLYKAMRDATITAGLRERLRIVHISLQRNHVHMLVEADTKLALARGMQGFQISAARHINTALGADRYRRRRGPVFADRYHLEVITSPTRARRALSYILNNWRKHREDRQGLART